MSDCAYYCLWLGAWGAIFACASGWFYSPMEHRGSVNSIADLLDQAQPVFWHRLAGIVATVAAFLLCLFAKGARGRNPDDGTMWKLGAILLAAGIGWVGHTGGELTYGKDHYKDLNELVEILISPAQSDAGPKAEGTDGSEPDQDDEADDNKLDTEDDSVEEGTPNTPTDI